MSGIALQDLGILDVEDWSGGFGVLFKEVFTALFDSKRKLREEFIPVLCHLEKNSFCASSPKTLGHTLALMGGQKAFINMATERELNDKVD